METIYAPNAVIHMLTGKAYARALRAHLLIYTALNSMLVENLKDGHVQETVELFVEITNKLLDGDLDVDELELKHGRKFDQINHSMQEVKVLLKSSRTSKLWLQYMDMIDILLKAIKSERTGNWLMHLSALSDMLPFLAASGHNAYTKSILLYLQEMTQLPITHPDVYDHFVRGNSVIRRSDRFWAGLPPDLVIEQVLMRTVKSTGGLTRGRGFSETQRNIWLLSMPDCAAINCSMQQFTGTEYISSEQHKELSTSRLSRDEKDLQTLSSHFENHNPFTGDLSLRNLTNGSIAEDTVNVDNAHQIGMDILKTMQGKTVKEYSFKKSMNVKLLSTKATVKIDGENVPIDSQLLFQRLIAVAGQSNCEEMGMEELFQYELCTYPSSLFECSEVMREANKSNLADTIWTQFPNESQIPFDVRYVLDGGSLLHRIPWTRGETYQEIAERYVDSIKRSYSEDTVIVFDGYSSTGSTKEATQERRASRKASSAKILFKDTMKLSVNKETFLSNTFNKQRFINYLSHVLEKHNLQTVHAKQDADVQIIESTIESARTKKTVLVGEDTDLLVLLCFHANITDHTIFFTSHQKNKHRIWNITKTKTNIGNTICRILPVIHAISGCDTTSRLFGIGKGQVYKRFQTALSIQRFSEVFLHESSKEVIASNGEKILICLYGGKPTDTINHLRYRRFCEKTATASAQIDLKTLPPTKEAALHHSLRVYYQVQEWTCKKALNPREWGWSLDLKNRLKPVMMTNAAAPLSLLRVIRCSCKGDCGTGKRCSCRKYGLTCTFACKECSGANCNNKQSVISPESNSADLFEDD